MKKIIFESPKKSAYSIEFAEGSWEEAYMVQLEDDVNVKKWTKNHGIRIDYVDVDDKAKKYNPDFLVEYNDGSKQIMEMKGSHLMNDTLKKKKEATEKWCKDRGMTYSIVTLFKKPQ